MPIVILKCVYLLYCIMLYMYIIHELYRSLQVISNFQGSLQCPSACNCFKMYINSVQQDAFYPRHKEDLALFNSANWEFFLYLYCPRLLLQIYPVINEQILKVTRNHFVLFLNIVQIVFLQFSTVLEFVNVFMNVIITLVTKSSTQYQLVAKLYCRTYSCRISCINPVCSGIYWWLYKTL